MEDPEEAPEVEPKEEPIEEPTPEPEAEEVFISINLNEFENMSAQEEYYSKMMAEQRAKQEKEAVEHLMSIMEEEPEPTPEPTPEEKEEQERKDKETEDAIQQMREALGVNE